MRRILSALLVFTLIQLVAATPISRPQEPAQNQTPAGSLLVNKDVVDMVKSGLTADVIVAKIKSSRCHFDTFPSVLAELKQRGVPDVVILAMVQSSPGASPSSPPAPANAALTELKIPDGTEIEIQLKNNLSGQEAKVGDVVDFMVIKPVQIGGITVFEKEASARARVTTAKPAGHWGHAGKLEWAMQDVQAVDGNRVPCRFTKRELGDSKGSTVAVAAVATTVLLGPLGLLWGLKKGKPAIIPAGNRYSVFVYGDTAVKVKSNSGETKSP
jgi:hypothetical protein